jgi:hypothetical protein
VNTLVETHIYAKAAEVLTVGDDGAWQPYSPEADIAVRTPSMTRKCRLSRAYHHAKTQALRDGKSRDQAKALARAAYLEAAGLLVDDTE